MRTSRRMLKQVRRASSAALAFSAFINVLMLATPLYILQVFGAVVPLGSLETLAVLSLMAAGALITIAILETARDAILLRTGLWLDHHLGAHLLAIGIERKGAAGGIEQDARALDNVRAFLVSGAAATLFDAVWVPVFIVAIAVLSPALGAVAAVSALALVFAGVLQNVATRSLVNEAGIAADRSQNWLRQTAAAHSASARLATGAASHWERINRGHISALYALGKRTRVTRVVARAIAMAAHVVLFGTGAWLIVHDNLAPGVLAASAALLVRVLSPLENLISSWAAAKGALNGYRRLKAHPSDADRQVHEQIAEAPRAAIVLRDISYRYANRTHAALDHVSLTIEPGTCLAITGGNGSGKSTLAAIVAGALSPMAGSAELAGVPIAVWQRKAKRAVTGYLPDEPVLLEGTVQANIACFESGTVMHAVEASERAGVHEILSGLPLGFDTEAGPNGAYLSLAERRAVALARAVYGAPQVVVLDEPQLGLDSARMHNLVLRLEAMKAAGTTLVIATEDPRLLALAGRIAVLKNGHLQNLETNFKVSTLMRPPRLVHGSVTALAGAG